jgi:[CysO sulfur-carrier protein]-S-L-cysteine hydrolase
LATHATTAKLKISKKLVDEIVAHARDDVPNECCGFISGKGEEALAVHRVTNAEASPYRYSMDFHAQQAAEAAIDTAGHEILAAYHSHTRSQAFPSQTDVNLALPHLMCVIASLQDAHTPVVKGFWIKDNKIAEAELVVE